MNSLKQVYKDGSVESLRSIFIREGLNYVDTCSDSELNSALTYLRGDRSFSYSVLPFKIQVIIEDALFLESDRPQYLVRSTATYYHAIHLSNSNTALAISPDKETAHRIMKALIGLDRMEFILQLKRDRPSAT